MPHVHMLPRINNPQLFEVLVQDLLNAAHNTDSFQLFGRNGQDQSGIDIYSHERRVAVQCKQRDNYVLNNSDFNKLTTQFENDLYRACQSPLPFDTFILASTIQSYTYLQEMAAQLSDRYSKTVTFWGWNKIERLVFESKRVREEYYAGFFRNLDVEIAAIGVVSDECAWQKKEKVNSFVLDLYSSKSRYPVFDFSFINHSTDTIVLHAVELVVEALPRGISGMPPTGVLRPFGRYGIEITDFTVPTLFRLPDPYYAMHGEPFRFQLQLRNEFTSGYILGFKFHVGSCTVLTPKLYLNADEDSYGIIARILY